jgi:hypothetical protein
MIEYRRAGLIPEDVATWVRRQDQAVNIESAFTQTQNEMFTGGWPFQEAEAAEALIEHAGFVIDWTLRGGQTQGDPFIIAHFYHPRGETGIELSKEGIFDWLADDPDMGPADKGALAAATDVMDDVFAQANDRMQELLGEKPELPTQYEQYSLPAGQPGAGGENYRELVLTAKPMPGALNYTAPHFGGTKNIVVHVRFQDFETEDGSKVLLIDEIQSDYHQTVRKQQDPNAGKWYIMDKNGERLEEPDLEDAIADTAYFNTKEEAFEVAAELATEVEIEEGYLTFHRVPFITAHLPFPHYTETAIRRMVRWAVEDGTYDGIGWTTGAQQAERYETEIAS